MRIRLTLLIDNNNSILEQISINDNTPYYLDLISKYNLLKDYIKEINLLFISIRKDIKR